MSKFLTPGMPSVPEQPGMQRSEKVRLLLLVLALLIVGGAFLASEFKGAQYRQAEDGDLPERGREAPTEAIQLPDIDAAQLDALVRDADPAQRVVLAPDAVELVVGWARRLGERHFAELGTRDLDGAALEALSADPSAARGAALRVRGWIESLRRRAIPGSAGEAFLVRLVLEDDSRAYVLALDVPDDQRGVGAFLRFDGLFLQLFSDELEGSWVDGPLLVAPRGVPSYRALEEPSADELALALASVRDDGVDGTASLPFHPLWMLMAHARDLPASAVDWGAVPEIDKALLNRLVRDGAELRGVPLRIGVSTLQGLTVKQAPENPARIGVRTEGWIGNTTWNNVVQFVLPRAEDELARRYQDAIAQDPPNHVLVSARGFFFKSQAYEPLRGGLHVAPLLVLSDLEEYVPPVDNTLRYVLWGFAALAIVLTATIALLLRRDRRRSELLHEEMVRRRRARRERTAADARPEGA